MTFIGILLVSLGIVGCGSKAPNGPDANGSTFITTSVNFPEQSMADMQIDRVALLVVGSGVDSIKQDMVFDGPSARAQVSVPVGKALTFTVSVLDSANNILMSGQTTTSVEKNQSNAIQITLNFMVPALVLTPTQTTVAIGDSIEVSLQARNVVNLTGLGARIVFDATRLQVVDMSYEQAFMTQNNGYFQEMSTNQDYSSGNVDFVMSVFPASSSVSGDGVIGKVVFKSLVADNVDLDISLDTSTNSDLGMYNSTAQAVDALTLGNRLIIQ